MKEKEASGVFSNQFFSKTNKYIILQEDRKLKKSKIVTIFLVLTLAIATFPVTALADSDYCPRLLDDGQCGKFMRWHITGRSISHSATHEYGGNIFGFGKSTCEYRYYYDYWELTCSAGHTENVTKKIFEYNHSSCGK